MASLRQREPVVFAQLIQTGLVALIGVLAAFGVWEPTQQQMCALTLLYVAIASTVTYVLRGTVYAPANVTQVELTDDV